jgi:hypothetical protein
MGLDAVELVMAVEEEFGIAIDDRDAERIVTVGQLWDYICERVTFVPTPVCATAAAFYCLRRAFVSEAGVARSEFLPASRLHNLLPRQARRTTWRRLASASGLKLPVLEASAILAQCGLYAAFLLSGIGAAIVLWVSENFLLAFLAVMFGTLGFSLLLDRLMTPWRNEINPAWASARGLAQAVVGLNPEAWSNTVVESREIAWQRLRTLIAENLCVSLELVRPEASFVNDLGMS